MIRHVIIVAIILFASQSSAVEVGSFGNSECKKAIQYHFLERACWYGDEIGVKILLELGADPSGLGYENYPSCIYAHEFSSPLYQASYGGHINIVRMLLDAGADPNLLQGEGVTPLVEAVRKQNIEIIKLLLVHGAKVDLPGLYYKPMDIAKQLGNRQIINLLKSKR
jgi:ankyrin repeat protein